MEMKMKTLENEICGKLTYEKYHEYKYAGLYKETGKTADELFNDIYEVKREIRSYKKYLKLSGKDNMFFNKRGLTLLNNYLKKLNKYMTNNYLIETMNIIMYELKEKSDIFDKYNF